MQRELYELTGINFDIEAIEQELTSESLGGDTADTAKAFYSSGTLTEYFANGFSFSYKGAVISGRLPRVYAGFAFRMDSCRKDLMPAVQKVCGFPLDLNEVGGC